MSPPLKNKHQLNRSTLTSSSKPPNPNQTQRNRGTLHWMLKPCLRLECGRGEVWRGKEGGGGTDLRPEAQLVELGLQLDELFHVVVRLGIHQHLFPQLLLQLGRFAGLQRYCWGMAKWSNVCPTSQGGLLSSICRWQATFLRLKGSFAL